MGPHSEPDRLSDGARMLDRAEGVLVGRRRCTIEAAFDEIVAVSQRHNVPALSVAQALVELAEGKQPGDSDAAAVARTEWSELFNEMTHS
jgi:ANTAR domain